MNNSSSEYDGYTMSVNGDLNYRLGTIADFTAAASYSRSSTLQAVWFGENTNYVAILKPVKPLTSPLRVKAVSANCPMAAYITQPTPSAKA